MGKEKSGSRGASALVVRGAWGLGDGLDVAVEAVGIEATGGGAAGRVGVDDAEDLRRGAGEANAVGVGVDDRFKGEMEGALVLLGLRLALDFDGIVFPNLLRFFGAGRLHRIYRGLSI